MNPAIIVAIIALVGSVVGGAIAIYGQSRSARMTVLHDAERILAKYREPLLDAAYELQARLYNILEYRFFDRWYLSGTPRQQEYALENTLYVLGQYFGWSEILRREIQLLSFSEATQTRAVAERQLRIVELFQSSHVELGEPFRIWRGEQRAIGELMIEQVGEQAGCIGYATFFARRDDGFRRWFEQLAVDVDVLARDGPTPRLVELQHALVDLIRELDPESLRYSPDKLTKVTAVAPARAPG